MTWLEEDWQWKLIFYQRVGLHATQNMWFIYWNVCATLIVGKTKLLLKTKICEHKCSIHSHDVKSYSHYHDCNELTFLGIEMKYNAGGIGDKL